MARRTEIVEEATEQELAAQKKRTAEAARIERACPEAHHIKMFLHCRRCIEEVAAKKGDERTSPSDYQQVEVGWTVIGIQVWCKRHNLNIMHMDLEGQKHPATMKALKEGTIQ